MINIKQILRESIYRLILEDSSERTFHSDIEAAEWFKENYPEYADYSDSSQEAALLLTNGKVIYLNDHYYILSTTDILNLGAIRLSRDGYAVELREEPTEQQYAVIDRVVDNFLHGDYELEIRRYYRSSSPQMDKLHKVMSDVISTWNQHQWGRPQGLGDKKYYPSNLLSEFNNLEKNIKSLTQTRDKLYHYYLDKYHRHAPVSKIIKDNFAYYYKTEQYVDVYIATVQSLKERMVKFIKEDTMFIKSHNKPDFSVALENKLNTKVIPIVRNNFKFKDSHLPYYWIGDDSYPNAKAEILATLSESIHEAISDYIRPFNSASDIADMIYQDFQSRIMDKCMDDSFTLIDCTNFNEESPRFTTVNNMDFYNMVYDICLSDQAKPFMLNQISNIIKAMYR